MPRYNPAIIEPNWQRFWETERTFATPRMPAGPKFYALDMFPYPSGDGLHVGHPEGYTATDIVSRYKRMRGYSVLHPMGFDSFGLPAEEHAIKTGIHPRIGTEKNIDTFRRQLKMLGFSYDWERELATTDVDYFRWTQWIFLQIYDTWYDAAAQRGRPISELPIPPEVKAEGAAAVAHYQDEHRLAYESFAPVNWCPALGTVLANEEVIDGKSERGGHPVVRMPLRQWMLRITAYAERLEQDLEGLDWSPGIKTLQRDWIGRSEGAKVDFYVGPLESRLQPAAEQSSLKAVLQREFDAWKQQRAKSGLPAKPTDDALRVYTTRPDTLFGATYMVLAPEHAAVEQLTTPAQRAAVDAYRQQAASKSDLDRTELAKEKTGVFTGAFALNPVNGQPVPIWIADYVLASYGTGAIMAVPAHDERDFEFAQKYQIPIVAVVDPGQDIEGASRSDVLAGRAVFTGDGQAINSGPYSGLTTAEFKKKITANLEKSGLGAGAVNYKLRDWLFSRQRFWGEPFPVLHELDSQGKPTGIKRTVPADQLPVDLPHLDDFKPHGRPEPPLDKAPDEWLYPVIDGVRYKRETNTMPQWAGSCWYYLRFIDPRNDGRMIDPDVEKAWMPIDLYVGGAEHAVLHLLYSRFWHKVLYDRGVVTTKEPFQKLVNQGMILGMVYRQVRNAGGELVSVDQVPFISMTKFYSGEVAATDGNTYSVEVVTDDKIDDRDGVYYLKDHPDIRVDGRVFKMSKSRGNVVNPNDVVKEYGADALRLYEMFMGPLEASKPWTMEDVNGVRNFLDRVWRLIIDDRSEELKLNAAVQDAEPTVEQNRVLHRTIKVVTADLESMSFNTAIARLMEFVNFFNKDERRPKSAMETLVLLLSPMAPHMGEELWAALGHTRSLAYEPWPTYDEALLKEESIEVPVQVNGKVRSKIQVPPDADQAALEAAARADEKIAEQLAGKTVVKVIIVPGRLVNFVVK